MITKIKIIGERCSGTNYLETLLETNYENINFNPKISGITTSQYKHFLTDFDGFDPIDTLVICIVRDPYDWLRSLHQKPWHLVKLYNANFSEFIRGKAASYREPYVPSTKYDKELLEKKLADSNNLIESFNTVIEMRNYKINKYLNSTFKNIEIISYDKLVKDINIVHNIANKYNIKLKYDQIKNITTYKGEKTLYIPKKYKNINKSDLTYINNMLNWSNENQLGFNKIIL